MIAVDTNVLIHAHRSGDAQHEQAVRVLRSLAGGRRPWALPFPCLAQFIRAVTYAGPKAHPVPVEAALHNLGVLLASPVTRVLMPTERHWAVFNEVLKDSGALGVNVFDAQIVALCLEHGVEEILTADRGFRRYSGIRITDPFRA